jgi:GTP pyrophosphokinase
MYAAIGYGGITAVKVIGKIREDLLKASRSAPVKDSRVLEISQPDRQTRHRDSGVIVEDIDSCMIKFSRCCTPVPGDDIMGFITRGQGVSIHRRDCANCQQLLSQPENEGRWVEVSWASKITDSYLTTIVVSAKDRSGLVMDVATVLNALNAKVHSLSARTTGINIGIVTVTLEVRDAAELRRIISRLTHVNGVSSVTRNGM